MSWLILTLVVLAAGLLVSFLVKKLLRTALLCVLGVFLTVVVIGTAVCWKAPDGETADADYGVLLGCALEDGEPKEELIRRLELGLQWLETHEGKMLIVSGGDPKGWGITEARVMYDWLENHGADMGRVLLEDQAKDTRENLLYSRKLAEENGLKTERVAILTSEYHQTRARYLAGQQGQTAVGISCRTPFWDHLESSVREVYSFVKAFFETL